MLLLWYRNDIKTHTHTCQRYDIAFRLSQVDVNRFFFCTSITWTVLHFWVSSNLFFNPSVILITVSFLCLYQGGYLASRSIHAHLLSHILRCPSSFFDTTLKAPRSSTASARNWTPSTFSFPTSPGSSSDTSRIISAFAVALCTSPWYLVLIAPVALCCYVVQVKSGGTEDSTFHPCIPTVTAVSHVEGSRPGL